MPTFFLVALRLMAVLLLASGLVAAHAQALPPGVQIGMGADALQVALPSVERVARPQRLPGGLSGSWRLASTVLAGLPFEATFYFAAGVLKRVEYVASAQVEPDRGASAFAQLLDWGRAAFGPEVGARDPGSAYASWVSGDTDIYAQHVDDPRRASVRLVYKARLLKDGGEL